MELRFWSLLLRGGRIREDVTMRPVSRTAVRRVGALRTRGDSVPMSGVLAFVFGLFFFR